jgi:uncharacterized membrane protein YjjP (DUF1212 family)
VTATEDATPVAPAVELMLGFARAGHAAGYPPADLEERLLALARSLGLSGAAVSATPTLIDVSLGPLPRQQTYSLRVRPQPVDLDAIARLDDLVQQVLDGRLDADQAVSVLASVERTPLARPWPVLLAAYAVAGAALTPVLGGTWREATAAAAVGLVVGAIAIPARLAARTEPMVAPLAAIAAGFSAAALARLGPEASAEVVTLAALVTLLPGMQLTIGMRELATEHLQSGVANTASALVQLLGLVFGVEIGRSIAASWFGASHEVAPHADFSSTHLLAALVAGLAFTVTLRAQSRDGWIMCGAAVLALAANEVGAAVFGAAAGVFVGTLAVGLAGGLVGVVLRRSALVFIVPGVLMLVPGSAGFESALRLLTDQTVSGITAGFDTFVTATSIAYGLIVSTMILPRRLSRLIPAGFEAAARKESHP